MIPYIFNFIHLGDKKLSLEKRAYIQSFKDTNPNAEIKVWSNADVQALTLPESFYKEEDFRAKSDVLRYWILANHGGIYCDTDVISLNSWEEWLQGKEVFVAQYDVGRLALTNAIMGAAPGNAFFPKLVDMLPGAEVIFRNGGYLQRVGSHLIDLLLATGKYPEVHRIEPDKTCSLTLAERAKGVIPNLIKLKEEGALCVHLWATAGDQPSIAKTYPALANAMLNALGHDHIFFGEDPDLLPEPRNNK